MSALEGPEEGPPRKKIKSPPAISPTGSSTSIYSGGSSSIDWSWFPPQEVVPTKIFKKMRTRFFYYFMSTSLDNYIHTLLGQISLLFRSVFNSVPSSLSVFYFFARYFSFLISLTLSNSLIFFFFLCLSTFIAQFHTLSPSLSLFFLSIFLFLSYSLIGI